MTNNTSLLLQIIGRLSPVETVKSFALDARFSPSIFVVAKFSILMLCAWRKKTQTLTEGKRETWGGRTECMTNRERKRIQQVYTYTYNHIKYLKRKTKKRVYRKRKKFTIFKFSTLAARSEFIMTKKNTHWHTQNHQRHQTNRTEEKRRGFFFA